MKPTSIVLLLVAVIAGGLAAYLATQQSGPVQVVEGPATVVEEAKTQVLVAMAPIGVGQRLSPATVQWGDWPEGALRDDYITVAERPEALTDITGAVARFEIFPGDPITEQKLVRTGQGYMSAVLDKGKRGVSVAVDAASASGGFIMPNDHVDVISSRQSPTGLVSEIILSNIKVLAIDARLGETGETGAPPDPDNPNAVFSAGAIATLELDPAQAEAVINAAQTGSVSLALRSIADFTGGPDAATQRSSQNVRLIRAGDATTVTTGRNETVTAENQNPDELSPATLSE